jgi:hypothetical protein
MAQPGIFARKVQGTAFKPKWSISTVLEEGAFTVSASKSFQGGGGCIISDFLKFGVHICLPFAV